MKLTFENEKIISKSNDVNSKIVDNIRSIYLKYTKDDNQDRYSSYLTQPISNIYCTTNLNNTIEEEQILIGKCRLIENGSILSNFYLTDIESKKYKEKFYIFDYEVENSKKLTNVQLQAIISCIFACNLTVSDRVYVVCDKEGDDYNSRSLDILKQVYAKLPYFIRKRTGYNTYSIGDDETARIKLIVTTKDNLEIEGAYVIDLNSKNYSMVTSRVNNYIKNTVKFLLELDDDRLIYIYDEIYNIYGFENLSIKKFMAAIDYFVFYKDRKIDDYTIECYINDINRGNEEYDKVDERLFKKMIYDIENNIDNKSLNNYIKKNFNNTEDLINIDKKTINAIKFMNFMQMKFTLDENLISDWFEQKRILNLKEKYNFYEIICILEDDKKILEELRNKIEKKYKNINIKEIDLIKQKAIVVIDKMLYDLKQKYIKYIKEERNELKNKLKNVNSLEDILESIMNIKYDENYNFIKQEVESKILYIMISYEKNLNLKKVEFDKITEKDYDNFCKDTLFLRDNDKKKIERLFKINLIDENIKNTLLDTINITFEHIISDAELNYYKNIILEFKDLNSLGVKFNEFTKKLKYPDKNNYELRKVLNSTFANKLNLDKQGYIDIPIEDLRNFLSECRIFLSQENIKLGYDCLQDKLFVATENKNN